jgi:predicted nucleotidyltransferase
MTEAGDIGLPDGWRDRCVAWAKSNGSICEIWLFGSRGPKGGAHMGSDVDIGIALMPKIDDHDWAFGDYAFLGSKWRANLEAIVQRHVSLQAMIAGNEGDEVIRSTGVCLWQR